TWKQREAQKRSQGEYKYFIRIAKDIRTRPFGSGVVLGAVGLACCSRMATDLVAQTKSPKDQADGQVNCTDAAAANDKITGAAVAAVEGRVTCRARQQLIVHQDHSDAEKLAPPLEPPHGDVPEEDDAMCPRDQVSSVDHSAHPREGALGSDGSSPADLELEGQVARIIRHGKALIFAYIQTPGDAEPQGVLFKNEAGSAFDHNGTPQPFPTSRRDMRVGDKVRVTVISSLQDEYKYGKAIFHVKRWHRVCPSDQTAPPLNLGPTAVHTRRSGKAARAGWVRCPLCPPSSFKRYNFNGGLAQHLDAIHYPIACADMSLAEVTEWRCQAMELALSMGASAGRTGGGKARGTGRGSERGVGCGFLEKEEHPGLVAARNGDLAVLTELLEGGWRPFDGGSLDHHGASALDWAGGRGHLACVHALLPCTKGLQPCRLDGRGPAHWAARHGQCATLKALLEAGCGHVEARTNDGTSMLMLACYGGHVEAAALLVCLGANVAARNQWDCDAGHFAAMGDNVEVCRWLVAQGVVLDRPQCAGHTALHKAADLGCLQVVRYLVREGGLTEQQLDMLRQVDGASPLMLDSPSCCTEVKPANEKCKDEGGTPHVEKKWKSRPPSLVARQRGHHECAELLAADGL
ncbi:hypothetical protein CYMTET_39725, partial [Cymbomonas tetramitiformis]